MKKLAVLLLGIMFCFSLCACGTGEKPDGGEALDYSNLNFNNMYGLNEWVEIESYHVYQGVLIFYMSGKHQVLCFGNGHIETRSFGTGTNQGMFTGDRSLGDLEDAYPYTIINDSLISIDASRNPHAEISVQVCEGIPLMTISLSGDGYGLRYNLEGTYIPTKMLDLESGEGFDGIVIYGVLAEYVDPRVQKYHEFAQSVLEAALIDFDSAFMLDAMHPDMLKYYANLGTEEGVDFKTEYKKLLVK